VDVPQCVGRLRLTSVGEHPGWRLTGTLDSHARQAVVVDRSGIIRGLLRVAPLVDRPQPSVAQIISAVRSRLSAGPNAPRKWLGFSQAGDGAPYLVQALDADSRVRCRLEPVGS
jgi:hypothetical protein